MTINPLYYNHKVPVITTEILGKARIPKALFDNPDGTLLIVNLDYSGNPRSEQNNLAGPFVNIAGNQVSVKVWQKGL
jgi:hypothetical protein